jgi:hypothetical protein
MKKTIYRLLILFTAFSLITTGCGKGSKEDEIVEEKVDIASISSSKIISVLSSSNLRGVNIDYRISNLFDKLPDGCWCEGSAGNGIGQYFELTFDKIVTVKKFSIMNGFADTKFYRKKNRIRALSINGTNVTLADKPYAQEIILKKPVTGKKIKFTITGIYKGERDEDACIAELSFQKIGIAPKKTIIYPVKISKSGYSFTINDEGKVNVTGVGDVDCPAIFVKGNWKLNSKGNYVINYTVKSDKMCGGIDIIKKSKSWDFDRITTVFTPSQLKRRMRF